MASIEEVKFFPVTDTVNPEIKMRTWLKIFGERSLPINFSGRLEDNQGTRIASLSDWEVSNNTRRNLLVNGSNSNKNIVINFHFRLTEKALAYIEEIRDNNANKDVELSFKLSVGSISSRFQVPNIQIDDNENAVNYLHLEKAYSNKSGNNLKLLTPADNGEILELEFLELSRRITITSSDWAQNYCPALGVGRFATVDLYIPDLEEAETELEKYLNDAIQTVSKMEGYIQSGEWSNVIEESRKLAEVLREKDKWSDLLIESGYHDDALERFNSMLQNLFQFSSKFVHRIDFDKNLRDQVKVEKEDAYFIYTTSIGLVNLLSRKVQEFKKSE